MRRRERLISLLARLRRFQTGAMRQVRWELRSSVGRLPRRLAGAVTRAWLHSDPDWFEKLRTQLQLTPEQQAQLAEQERRRDELRARRLADGEPAVYEGELSVRMAFRGVILADRPDRPGIEDWVIGELGFDGWNGDTATVHISVELLDSTDKNSEPETTEGP